MRHFIAAAVVGYIILMILMKTGLWWEVVKQMQPFLALLIGIGLGETIRWDPVTSRNSEES